MGRFLELEGVDAVVFDCDGVLVDSEPVSETAWRVTLDAYGIDLGPDFGAWIGTTDESIALRFADEAGVTAERLVGEAGERLLDTLATDGVTVFEDALAALAQVRNADMGLAVATNSARWRLEAILGAAGLDGVFTCELTADDVANPKPAPDIYLEAAERLDVPVSRCLVIEDSPVGVAAARSAGMRVVAVDRGVFTADELAPATRIVDSLGGRAGT